MSDVADILERFRRGGELLAMSTTGAAGSELDFKPAGGHLSVRQIVCHLADAEIVGAMRLRQIIAEDNPTLQRFNGDALGRPAGLRQQDFPSHRNLPPTANGEPRAAQRLCLKPLSARRNHTQSGPLTLIDLVKGQRRRIWKSHVQQIQRTRAAYKEHRAKQAAQAPRPALINGTIENDWPNGHNNAA